MKAKGYAGNPENITKAKRDIKLFIRAIRKQSRRLIWARADKQFRRKHSRWDLPDSLFDMKNIELKSITFFSKVFFSAEFETDILDVKINFMAQNKAYKTNAGKSFKFVVNSIR